MEPDQQSTAERDNETSQPTETEQNKCKEKSENIETDKVIANENQSTETCVDDQKNSNENDKVDDTDVVVPQDVQLNSTDTKKSELENNNISSENSSEKKEASNDGSSSNHNVDHENENSSEGSDEKKNVENENKNNNDSKITNSNYASAGSGKKVESAEDKNLKIDRESLFDRVILYSLKNTVVDNSRLDAAKNKYMKNNGNLNASFNSNNSSNGSDSNSTSKSVDKLIEEFKGSCKSNNENASVTKTVTTINNEQDKNDNKEISNGADKSIDSLVVVNKKIEHDTIEGDIYFSNQTSAAVNSCTKNTNDVSRDSPIELMTPQQSNKENEGLDFREKSSNYDIVKVEDNPSPAMLDLSVKRDDKSVPPIKRSHALYVGLPDFSKQIFTAPSITRTTNTISNQAAKPLPSSSSSCSVGSTGAPKIRNPDFSNVARAPELQMKHPDFSRSFSSSESPPSANVPITPSNFPEIIRKNNYISDLQLKPPSNSTMTPSTSYKIDYHPPQIPAQMTNNEQQNEDISGGGYNKSPYQNSKKESGIIYNQQLVDEPMAHIIHKNQFLPNIKEPMNQNWNEHRGERLLGGSSHYEVAQENKMSPASQPFSSKEDLRKLHPAHYPYGYKDREHLQSHEFSLKQKEQQLRQEGTTITIKNENNARTPTQIIHERRSADLFRDYKLKQPKESPDTRMNEPPPLTYHQQYPDFPPNYLRNTTQEASSVKINSNSPVPQHSHTPHEYSSPMSHYKTPSPIQHRQQKSPATMLSSASSPMNPPQNWPPMPLQGSRHSMSPANVSPSSSYLYPHASSSKSSMSPSQSPISHYPYHTSPKLNHQMFKQPESSSNIRSMEPKSSRPQPMIGHSPSQHYYHQKFPDFARKFEAERSNSMYYDPNSKNNSSFIPIDTKPLTIDVPHQNLPVRQDLEIRSIREPSMPQNAQYRHSSYNPMHDREISRNTQAQPLQEMRSHYSRMENEAAIVLPDLKIEKRTSEPAKVYSPVPTRRQEAVSELSIIPKIKTEPPSTPIPSSSNIIKSAKTLFAEVKRESPLDLSVKTIKTKADSTGCDTDFRNRKESKLGLKVEFTPNFANVVKTECRQQARIGPQDYNMERPDISARYIKEQEIERNRSIEQQIPPTNPRNNFYDYKQQQPIASEMDRPHAPVPTLSSYYADRQKPSNSYEGNRQMNAAVIAQPESLPRSYENMRIDQNYQQNMKSFQVPPQRSNYHPSQSQANIPYPVISKAAPAISDQRLPSHSKDPWNSERERDRKYVEEILYGRNRKEIEQKQYQPESRQFQPIPSPPRKRHSQMSNQYMYDSIPQKQSRVEEPHRMYPQSNVPSSSYERRDPNLIPPTAAQLRPEPFTKVVSTANDVIPKHYPIPRKDVIKSAEMLPYNNQTPPVNYYPNPKAEMIHRSDPTNSQKYYSREPDRSFYHQQPMPKQNFHQRPDDAQYPSHVLRISHPVQDMSIKVEQQTPGPIQENQGESRKQLNHMLMPSSVSGSNGNIARGAEQSTILKLKSNLELKEMAKLKKSELSEEMEHLKQANLQHQHRMKVDLSPRQFRTKGELKGFTPIPMKMEMTSTVETSNAVASGFDLLDWGSACNDFVQQLQTGSRKRFKKKRPFSSVKNFIKNDDKMLARLPGTTSNDLSEVPKEILQSINEKEIYSSSDEDKPLVEIKNSISQQENMPEKLSRNFREKQRQFVEQKFAARLGRPSSSDSETDTRKSIKSVKRVRRLRKREQLGIKKTDDEHSVEEGEIYEDYINLKGKSLKIRSKLDDLTSSDEEKKKSANGDKTTTSSQVKSVKKSSTDDKSASVQKDEPKSSSESSDSTSEEEQTTEDKINKLSTAKNAKKLKDLGDGSNIKNLLEEERMTRSKRKLENEKKLSNSKILRNEKVVQNVTRDKKAKVDQPSPNKKSPLKRKDSNKSEDSKRKAAESETEKETSNTTTKKQRKSSTRVDEKSSSEKSSEEEEEDNRMERLRPRKNKIETESALKTPKEANKKKAGKDEIESTLKASDYKEGRRSLSALYPFRDDKTSKFTPGWETEAYNFKRSLNVPPDPQTSDTSEIFSEFIKSKDRDAGKDLKAEFSKGKKMIPGSTKNEMKKPPNSMIELLHQRVIESSNRKIKQNKKTAPAVATPAPPPPPPPIVTKSNSDELLATPEKSSDKVFGFKKNIFEPFVITSRTRTENNALRKKEILKEVFGADDERPRSAPPNPEPKHEDAEDIETEPKISYDQKYREYLDKMNVDFPDRKSFLSKLNEIKVEVKEEEDEFDDNETVVASERDLVTPTMKGKVKKNRPRRLKGSSGFDYIRKKKKPTHNTSENPLNVNTIIKKRLAAMENQETKDENDISKEIKGWVLNKGVGESVLHKASRLNYVDVVAYCLDRLSMNADSKDNAGYTPLHEACSRGHLEIARLLLQYGANHSEAALSGIRPLHEAIENGHVEMVRLLLSFGADPCLATYSGQMPISMAEDKEMEEFLGAYLIDVDHKVGTKTSWFTDGAFKIEDPDEVGYDIFSNVPIVKTDLGSSVASILSTSMTSLITATTQLSDNETVISETAATIMKAPTQDLIKYQHKMKKCDTNSNNLVISDVSHTETSKSIIAASKKTKNCSVLLSNIDSAMKKIKKLPSIPKLDLHAIKANSETIHKIEDMPSHKEDYDDMIIDENLESDCEFLEVEESQAPLPPLYLLRDEGSEKWILLTDLCNLLKVKSKEAVLKQIKCPSSPPAESKELIRELKMSDFLEKAMCLQLFCAGEKINIRASKVSLVRYNESVKNLLGVQTIRMNM